MNAFEITFLGTGTSTGVPIIACDCAVCTSADPRDSRDRSSISVRTADCSWVVDTGPDFRRQCLRAGIRHLDAALITHAHTDHIMGFDDLRRFTFAEHDQLPVYATTETLEALRRIFDFAFNGENRFAGYFKPDPRPVDGPFPLGQTEVTPVPVEHGRVMTTGFVFARAGKRVAYIPDCKFVPASSVALLQDLDLLIIDSLRPAPHPTHMCFDEALALVAEVSPKQAFGTHFSHEVLHADLETRLPPQLRPAWDGLVLSI